MISESMLSRGMTGILVATSCALVSCSVLTSLNDLSGPVVADASTEASTLTGSTDSGTTDANGTPPTGLDAAVDGGADAGPRFCSLAPHDFCADFDDGKVGMYAESQVGPDAKLEVSQAHSTSAKYSLHSVLPRRSSGDLQNALVIAHVPGAWKHTIVEMDVFPDTTDWQTGDINCALTEFDFTNGSTRTPFYIVFAHGYSQLNGTGFNINMDGLPENAWIHFKLDFQPSGAFVGTVNGKPFTAMGTALTATGTAIDLAIGVTGYNAPVPGFSVYYDNVTVDFL